MHVAARLTSAAPAGAPSKERHYLTANGVGLSSQASSFVAIAEALRLAWPRALTFQELLDAARPKAKKTTTDAQLGEEILTHLVLLLNANALCYRLEPVGYAHEEPQPRWIPA